MTQAKLDGLTEAARQAMAHGEERLRIALAAARMGTYDWSAADGALQWSEQTARLHGIEPGAFRGTIEHARELTHPADHERVVRVIEEAAAAGQDFEVEYRTRPPAGQPERWLYAYGRTFKDPAGTVRTIGAVLDVTEQKRSQEALQTSVANWQTLSQVGKLASAELNLEKLVQFITDAATQLSKAHFGAFFYNVISEKGESYTLYTISGVPREAFSNFPMPRATAVFRPTFEGAGVVRSDDITADPRYGKSPPHHGMPHGHLPVVSYLAVPVVSRTGEVLGGLFFGHPKPGIFTEREEELVTSLAAQAAVAIDNVRLFQRAQDAVHLRDEFLSIASHELKTPLTPLLMQVQSLKRLADDGTLQALPPDRLRKLADTCERQVLRLASLVDNLLDVSRINAGRLRLDLERVDLVKIVRDTIERYAAQLSAAGCAPRVHAPARLEGQWDALRLEQVLANLVMNAIKYAPGKPVTVTVAEEGGEAVLKVKDEGEGIAEADRERIFRRFERAGPTANVAGLGLGLFITHQIVESHGGRVQVESAPGKGATFIIRLPLSPA